MKAARKTGHTKLGTHVPGLDASITAGRQERESDRGSPSCVHAHGCVTHTRAHTCVGKTQRAREQRWREP